MPDRSEVIFLVDVDNTLLDNDRIVADLRTHLETVAGLAGSLRYWAILDELFITLGYRDYLGALQRYRVEQPHDPRLFSLASYLVDYPFAECLYPDALAVLRRLAGWGTTVLLTDGDAVFQPRKVERSGLHAAVAGRVLIYVHKEEQLDDVIRQYPARHFVLIDDKLRILSAVKRAWGERVTTVFPRQGSCANDPVVLAAYPPADLTVARIGDLLDLDRADLLGRRCPLAV